MSDGPERYARHGTIVPPSESRQGLPYRAIVAGGDDPLHLGRIRVIIPELTDKAVHPEWAWPIGGLMGGSPSGDVKYGALFVPPEGSLVDVMFRPGDSGNLHPAYLPGWIPQDRVPDVLDVHYPNRRGLVTPSGHFLYFDDSTVDADSGVQFGHRNGSVLAFRGNKTTSLASADALNLGGGVSPNDPANPAARKGDAVHGGTLSAKVTCPPGGGIVDVMFIYTPKDGIPGAPSTSAVLSGGKVTAGSSNVNIN